MPSGDYGRAADNSDAYCSKRGVYIHVDGLFVAAREVSTNRPRPYGIYTYTQVDNHQGERPVNLNLKPFRKHRVFS